MDVQFYGANCLSLTLKTTRIIIDDDLESLGKKTITKPGDVSLFTTRAPDFVIKDVKIVIDCPGEYEVADISIVGIPARAHTDEPEKHSANIFKIVTNDISLVITGHIYPELTEGQLESIGMSDVLVIPVGGHGYTLDPSGALKVIKSIEPKVVIPTHYEQKGIKYPMPQETLETALSELSMAPKETVPKLRLRSSDLSDITELIVIEAN